MQHGFPAVEQEGASAESEASTPVEVLRPVVALTGPYLKVCVPLLVGVFGDALEKE